MPSRPRRDENSATRPESLLEVAAGAARDSGVPPDLLGNFLDDAAAAIRRGRRLDSRRVSSYQRYGADAAARNVELAALIDLYLSAAWRLWRQVPTLIADSPGKSLSLVAAGEGVLRTSDDVVAAVAAGYQTANSALLLQTASARREFVEDLLANHGHPGELHDRAEAFGLRLTGAHRVAVAELPGQRIDDSHVILSQATAICRASSGYRNSFVTSKDGRLIAVLASAANGSDTAPLMTQLRAIQPDLRAGIGRQRSGESGPMRSYREALECLEVARRLRIAEPVAHAEDLLVYLALFRDRETLADLVRSVLQPLASMRGGAAPYLDTLQAYFDHRSVATAAANALHLSVRGLTYRLERIRRTLQHDLDQPQQRLTVELALTAARLLDWPDQPLPDPAS